MNEVIKPSELSQYDDPEAAAAFLESTPPLATDHTHGAKFDPEAAAAQWAKTLPDQKIFN